MAVYHNSFKIPDDATLGRFSFENVVHTTEMPQPVSSRLVGIISDVLQNPIKYRNSRFDAWVHNNDGFLPGNSGDGTFSVSFNGTLEGEEINSYTIERADKPDYRIYVYDLIEIPLTYSGEEHTFTSPDGWIFRAVADRALHLGGLAIKNIIMTANAIEWAPSFTVDDIRFFTNILEQEVMDSL